MREPSPTSDGALRKSNHGEVAVAPDGETRPSKREGTGALATSPAVVCSTASAFPKIHAQALKLHDIGEPDN
jgi:hypothetical protein